jgi:putative hemolysin
LKILPAVLLFVLCLLLSAFFSSSETAFVAVNPYSLEHSAKKGSRRAALVQKILSRINSLLATILVGNTLVNAAAASLATSFFVTVIPDQRKAILYATAATTLLILLFSEINPKTFAAHNPLRTSLLFSYPIRASMILFFPIVKVFTLLTDLLVPSSRRTQGALASDLSEEEVKIALRSGARSLSALKNRMISGVLDIESRPVKEIMVPRLEVKAIEIGSPLEAIVSAVKSCGFSRYPIYRGRIDHVEGIIHAKDVISYLVDKKDFDIHSILREPFFVPDLASIGKVLLQMQEKAVHMAVVVDEFGNMEGLVTLEDIIEEIVGEIEDEHDVKVADWLVSLPDGSHLVKGAAPVKQVNGRLAAGIPDKSDYTTLAGFFLHEFGRLPHERDALEFGRIRLVVEKMNKRHIGLIRVEFTSKEGPPEP